jgi:hypothetical protein
MIEMWRAAISSCFHPGRLRTVGVLLALSRFGADAKAGGEPKSFEGTISH